MTCEAHKMTEEIEVYPGIVLSYDSYRSNQECCCHEADDQVMEINYCHDGRVGWTMDNHMSLYLGAEDVSVHLKSWCADSQRSFPLGYYEGISVALDFHILRKQCPPVLSEAGFCAENVYEKFASQNKPIVLEADRDLDSIFHSLFHSQERYRRALARLKMQELLLYLDQAELKEENTGILYGAEQTDLIRRIHQQLTEHIDRRYTIEELSKQYLMNTSTLKAVFKAVYGKPIATYMKEYRIRQAMRLLQTTQYSIAEIAQMVGYETQGKFAAAFKKITCQLPREYRRMNQEDGAAGQEKLQEE